MSKAITPEQTGFDAQDLAIRNRVLAFKAALDAAPVAAPSRDALLSQFTREVNDLTAQLAQVEAMFGPNDPMALVLREALASAESRRDTRRIEMGDEDTGSVGKAITPAPNKTAHAITKPVHDRDDDFLWALLLFWSWKRSHPTPDSRDPVLSGYTPAQKLF